MGRKTDYFQVQLEEIKRQPGENIIAYGFRLKNIFEHGYPKTACTTQAEEATRLEMLRQKFLTGLDGPLKNKVRYKEFEDYEELVRKQMYVKQINMIIDFKPKKKKAVDENLSMPSLQQFLHQTLSYYGLLSITSEINNQKQLEQLHRALAQLWERQNHPFHQVDSTC